MKIIPLLIVLFITVIHFAVAQFPAEDALILAPYLDSGKLDEDETVYSKLGAYVSDPSKRTDALTIIETFAGNPFFELGGLPLATSNIPDNNRGDSFLTGALGIPEYADGFAKFLVARAKEELNTAFFRKFKEQLVKGEEHKDLRTLFPQTTATLSAIDIYRYSSSIQILRDAFEQDLSNLFTNTHRLINKSAILDDIFTNHSDKKLKELLLVTLDIAEKIGKGNAEEALNVLSESNYFNTETKSYLQLVRTFSNSLRSSEQNKYWISSSELNALITNENALRIYFGLLYTSVDSKLTLTIEGKQQNFKKEVLGEMGRHWNEMTIKRKAYTTYLSTLIEKATYIETSFQTIRKQTTSEYTPTYNDYYQCYIAVNSLLEFILTKNTLPDITLDFDKKAVDRYLYISRTAGDLYLNVAQKKYSTAVINTVMLLDTLSEAPLPYRAELLKYGSFMAAMAQAQNSDEVQQAIEAAVLPVGSSSIKKHSNFSLSLNSYVGGYLGEETIKPDKENIRNFTAGMTAPIGIGGYWGNIDCIVSSVGIYASLVDLGAITAFRFNDDSTDNLPEFKLENIIAPGGYIVFSLGELPLAIGGGIQSGPQLRGLNTTAATISETRGYRWSVFLSVDIPLLNFYTSGE